MKTPEGIEPKIYDIELKIDLSKKEYFGRERIIISIERPRKSIIINAKEIDILKVKLEEENLKFRKINDENIEIFLNKNIFDDIELYIEFKGKIRDDYKGLYKIEKRDILLTNLLKNASYFIPCFEKPYFRSVFKLKVILDKNFDVLFNTEPDYIEIEGNKKIIKFKNTPKIPIYSLLLVIGNFEYFSDKYKNKNIRIASLYNENYELLVDWIKKVLEFYEEYSSIKYQPNKLDIVLIEDILYNYNGFGIILLNKGYDNKKDSNFYKIKLMKDIAKSLWYYWIGGLVSIKDWKDLWLIDSLSEYMAYKVLEKEIGNISSDLFFLENIYSKKLEEIVNPKDLHIKGYNLWRMLDKYLYYNGKDFFRLTIINYINKYTDSSSSYEDLIKEFELIGRTDILYLINSWIKKEGYPLISINTKKKEIYLKQERMTAFGKENKKWYLPLFLYIDKEFLIIPFNKNKGKILLKKEPQFFIFNKDSIGFYSTYYDKDSIKYVIRGIKNNEFNDIDKANLIYDYYLLNITGRINMETLFNIIDYLKNERSWLVLSVIFSIIYEINNKFEINILNKFKDIFYDVEVKDIITQKIKNIYLIYNGILDNKHIIDFCFEQFENYEKLDPNIREGILFNIAIHGGLKEFNKLLELYRKSKNSEEKEIMIMSLANFRKRELVEKLLNYLINNEIELKYHGKIFNYLSLNPISKLFLEDLIKKETNNIKKYEKYPEILNELIKNVLYVYSNERIDYIKKILLNIFPDYKKIIEKYYKISLLYKHWVNRERNNLKEIINNLL